ncbi:MAG TPA: hypothetical protein VIN03_10065 [Roseateles sp.]
MPAQTSERFNPRLQRLIAGLISLLALGGAQAEEADRPGLRFSGFGSLGLAHIDAPDGWGFRRELNQPGSDGPWSGTVDSRLGLQLNYNLGPSLEVVGQVIARKRGAFSADTEALEWGYASYRPNADWTLRAGRVNVDAFLMADYRNVGYGYLPARPPLELYARLPTTLDGGDLARSWFAGDAQWRVKLFAGSTRIGDVNFSKASKLHAVAGAMVSREEGGWLLRASFARSRIDFDQSEIQQALAALGQLSGLPIPGVAQQAGALRQRLSANGIDAQFTELGARYEGPQWQWSAEVVRVSAAPLTVDRTAYVTLGFRMGDWTPFVSVGRARNSVAVLENPVWQPQLAPLLGPVGAAQLQMLGEATTRALNGARMEQSSWSVGARWDFHPQAALKLQWDHFHALRGGSSLWTNALGAEGRARVASAVVDFIF